MKSSRYFIPAVLMRRECMRTKITAEENHKTGNQPSYNSYSAKLTTVLWIFLNCRLSQECKKYPPGPAYQTSDVSLQHETKQADDWSRQRKLFKRPISAVFTILTFYSQAIPGTNSGMYGRKGFTFPASTVVLQPQVSLILYESLHYCLSSFSPLATNSRRSVLKENHEKGTFSYPLKIGFPQFCPVSFLLCFHYERQ